MNDIKEGRFKILEKIFSYNYKNKSYNNEYKIDFKDYVNMPEVVDFFKSQFISTISGMSGTENSFGIESCYHYLSEDNKLNQEIVNKYVESITRKSLHENIYVNSAKLFQIPIEKFHEEDFLSKILPVLNIKDFQKYFNKENQKYTLLSDINFIKKNMAHIEEYKLIEIIDCFVDEKDIDKSFIMNLIKTSPNLYSIMAGLENTRDRKGFTSFKNYITDIDIVHQAYVSGLKIIDIKFDNLKDEFLKTNSSEIIENFKLKYLIANGFINIDKVNGTTDKKHYSKQQDLNFFKEKYNKLEHLYFKSHGWSIGNKDRDKLLKNIKDKNQLNDLVKKMIDMHSVLRLELDSLSFYRALNKNLINDFELVKKLKSMGEIEYTNLSENLQYNKEVALWFINDNEDVIKSVPVEFFNDIDFALKFTKLIDCESISIRNAPSFMHKFFENHRITENYHDNLKTYMLYMDMKDNIVLENPNQTKVQRKKI